MHLGNVSFGNIHNNNIFKTQNHCTMTLLGIINHDLHNF